jgi:hypothetical protein
VHESQVSRDERNDYHGVTIDRANHITKTLGFALHYTVTPTKPRRASKPRSVPAR